jgi:hypothetical protein
MVMQRCPPVTFIRTLPVLQCRSTFISARVSSEAYLILIRAKYIQMNVIRSIYFTFSILFPYVLRVFIQLQARHATFLIIKHNSGPPVDST